MEQRMAEAREEAYEDPEFSKAEERDGEREMLGVDACEKVRNAAKRRVAEMRVETKRRVDEVYAETLKRMDEIYRDVDSRLSTRREQHIAEARMENDPDVAVARIKACFESDIVEEFAEVDRQQIQLHDEEARRTAGVYEELRRRLDQENAEMIPRLLAEIERVDELELWDE
jgi:DNA anti-recombination protein RmuC